jgi:hypothetical protein
MFRALPKVLAMTKTAAPMPRARSQHASRQAQTGSAAALELAAKAAAASRKSFVMTKFPERFAHGLNARKLPGRAGCKKFDGNNNNSNIITTKQREAKIFSRPLDYMIFRSFEYKLGVAMSESLVLETNQGATDPQQEGAYRRGYHQAVAEVAYALRHNKNLTADELDSWVEGCGMQWRKEVPLEQMILPPDIG